jgi:hypothetical protein
VDDWQHQGVGYLMVQLISTLAAAAGIRRFTFATLATNTAVIRMLEAAGVEWGPIEGPTLLGSAEVRAAEVPGVERLLEMFESWPPVTPPPARDRGLRS